MRNEPTASTTKRGTCPVCGRNGALTKQGVLWWHVDALVLGGSHLMPSGGRCDGVGQPPKDADAARARD